MAGCCACCDVVSLFAQLGIPSEEQRVLWNLANKEIGCKSLKSILLVLQRNNKLKKEQI